MYRVSRVCTGLVKLYTVCSVFRRVVQGVQGSSSMYPGGGSGCPSLPPPPLPPYVLT